MPRIPGYLASFEYRPPRGGVTAAGAPGRMLTRFGEATGGLMDKIARQQEMASRLKQAEAEAAGANGTAQAMAELQNKKGVNWPTDPETRRDMIVSHKKALADGGTNNIRNIEPLPQAEHIRRHREAGDHARWAKRRWQRKDGQ